jgi:hypothetical protein
LKHFVEGNMAGREEEEENVGSYRMTLRKREQNSKLGGSIDCTLWGTRCGPVVSQTAVMMMMMMMMMMKMM